MRPFPAVLCPFLIVRRLCWAPARIYIVSFLCLLLLCVTMESHFMSLVRVRVCTCEGPHHRLFNKVTYMEVMCCDLALAKKRKKNIYWHVVSHVLQTLHAPSIMVSTIYRLGEARWCAIKRCVVALFFFYIFLRHSILPLEIRCHRH